MKNQAIGILLALAAVSCGSKDTQTQSVTLPIVGTWKLLQGTTIKGNDTTRTDYTKGQEMIKIISPTHFAFLRHDLQHGKDSTADYSAGGGRVTIGEKNYTEYLDYFNVREWEGGKFDFEYHISGDTLTITGIEKVEKLGVNHLNIETYIRQK